MAWLHASEKGETTSRQAVFENEGHEIEFPECRGFYVLEYLFDVGLSLGENALTHSEIQSWQHNTGTILQPWESRFLKRLSVIYLGEFKASNDAEKETAWEEAPGYMRMAYRKMLKSKQSLRKLAE